MADIQQTSHTSPYSYTSIKYWCSNCNRQFSQLRVDDSMTQAYCPRCNTLAQEILQNTHESSSSSSSSSAFIPNNNNNFRTEQTAQEPTNASQSQNGGAQAYFLTQTFMDPFGRVFITRTPIIVQRQGNNGANAQNNMTQEQQNQTQTQNQNQQSGDAASAFAFTNLLGGLNPFFGAPLFGFMPTAVDERLIEEFLRNDPNKYGPPPASQEDINKLQEIKFDGNNGGAEVVCCPICQENYQQDETLVKLPCKHDFHKDCVTTWLTQHNSCPMCRQAI